MILVPEPLTAEAFMPFGDIIGFRDEPDLIINQGMCGRHHDLGRVDFGDGRAGISLFDAESRQFPYELEMVERHPLGSQAFMPLTPTSFLVIVAKAGPMGPEKPRAFVTSPGQGINLLRNTWHGVLTPLAPPGQFLVIDRIGPAENPGNNLEEYWFDTPYVVAPA